MTERDLWRKYCADVMADYIDAEVGHRSEDELLADFVADLADGAISDPAEVAQIIQAELLRRSRTKWFA